MNLCQQHHRILVVHLQTVRTAFNVAIGADSDQIKRTARNALLQMLNTIVKRVSLFPLVSHHQMLHRA